MVEGKLSRRNFLGVAAGAVAITTLPQTVCASARVSEHFDPVIIANQMGSDIFRRRPSYSLHTKLALLFDVSASIQKHEYEIQKIGTAQALRSRRVKDSIENRGGITLCLHEFSSSSKERLPWMVIETSEDADTAAKLIESMPHFNTGGKTGLSLALYSMPKIMAQCPVTTMKSVIDISGDGNDSQASPHPDVAAEAIRSASNKCSENGITCNGLALPTDTNSSLPNNVDSVFMLYNKYIKTPARKFVYFKDYGQGHVYKEMTPEGFVIGINDWSDFQKAMEIKLSYEIAGLSPLPEQTRHPSLMFA